jgi:hypothetical protein
MRCAPRPELYRELVLHTTRVCRYRCRVTVHTRAYSKDVILRALIADREARQALAGLGGKVRKVGDGIAGQVQLCQATRARQRLDLCTVNGIFFFSVVSFECVLIEE